MKAIFGILSLLVVLAIVGSIAKKQLQAISGGSASARNASAAAQSGAFKAEPGSREGATFAIPGAMPGAVAGDPNAMTVPQQSRSMQEKARADTVRALQQGVQRNERAEPR